MDYILGVNLHGEMGKEAAKDELKSAHKCAIRKLKLSGREGFRKEGEVDVISQRVREKEDQKMLW